MAGLVTSNLDPSTLVAPVLFSSSFARAADLMRRKHADDSLRKKFENLDFFLALVLWRAGARVTSKGAPRVISEDDL